MAITILFMCVFLYFSRGKKRENYKERIMMYGFACIFIQYAVGFFFQYLRGFAIPGMYVDATYYGDYDKVGSTYKTLSKLIYISGAVSFIFFLLAFEITVKRTKYVLTFIQVGITLIIIGLPYESARSFHHVIYYPFRITSLIIIFYLFTKWSRLEFKAVSSLLLVGIGIIEVGTAIASRNVMILNVVPLYLYPPIIILGVFVAILPLIIDPKRFSQALFLWKLNGAILISIIGFFCVFLVYYFGLIYYQSFFTISYGIVFLFVYYRTIIIIKEEQLSGRRMIDKKGTEEKELDILGMFTRPQKLTEEEVTISKEKKICLVCKGKVGGVMFMCTNCGTLYCIKCSEALSNLENVCWVCNEAIDKSKPVKPFKKEEEKVMVEEKIQKS